MTSKFLISVLITLSIIIAPTSALAYVQVLGTKDGAPGQAKKNEKQAGVEVDVNVGRVEQIKDGLLSIKSQDKKFEILTDVNTKVIEKPKGQAAAPGILKKNDRVAIFATPSAEASRGAHLLLFKPATASAQPETRRRAVYGLVRQKNGSQIVVSHPLKDSSRFTIEAALAKIKVKGIDAASAFDINVGDRVAAVGVWSGDVLIAKIVHVIPGKATGLLEKVATGSASPTATPSATPTATPSASP